MNNVSGIASATSLAPGAPDRERLQAAMRQLESVFVQQLFKAMRETVPDEGIVSGGSGEQIFTGLLDEKLSEQVPAAWHDQGLESALMRQFRTAVQPGPTGDPGE